MGKGKRKFNQRTEKQKKKRNLENQPDKSARSKVDELIKEMQDDPESLKLGRPSSYRPEYADLMINWFDKELTEVKERTKVIDGSEIVYYEDVPVKPPTFSEFSRKVLGVFFSTMKSWVDKYEEFRMAYMECKEIQKEIIVTGSLMGVYNASYGRFVMKNISEWRDNITAEIKSEKPVLELAYHLNAAAKDKPAPRRIIGEEPKRIEQVE